MLVADESMVLHLSPGFYPKVEGTPLRANEQFAVGALGQQVIIGHSDAGWYERAIPKLRSFIPRVSRFKGGEAHVKCEQCVDGDNDKWETIDVAGKRVCLTIRLNDGNDIQTLLMAADMIERCGGESTAFFPYVPYARQDKAFLEIEPFSLEVFARQINSAGFKRVYYVDPHSVVTPALIKNSKVISNYDFIKKVLERMYPVFGVNASDLVLVGPDNGAYKKFPDLMKAVGGAFDTGFGAKCRTVATMNIDKQVFVGDVEDKDALMIDDICDGGRTFIGLAKILKEQGARRIFLAVTHGIFSYGFDVFDEYFDGLFCTDSIQSEYDSITPAGKNLPIVLPLSL